jgi:DNA-binding CsgD family transcriptional regulator
MRRLSRTDLERVLAFLGEMSADDGGASFPIRLFDGLRTLFPRTAMMWTETEGVKCAQPGETRLSREAWWDFERWWPLRHLDPLHRNVGIDVPRPVMYSDYLTSGERRTDIFWNEVLRPAGIQDTLVVTLPAPLGTLRTIGFDSFDREFSERDREVLIVLRPHLGRLAANAQVNRIAFAAHNGAALTPRQLEVLHWVALGKTNAEIAGLLYLSTGTVRKHMDNIFATLGVHTRTAAVTMVSANNGP